MKFGEFGRYKLTYEMLATVAQTSNELATAHQLNVCARESSPGSSSKFSTITIFSLQLFLRIARKL